MTQAIAIHPIEIEGEIVKGADIAAEIEAALGRASLELRQDDVLVVTQKIVSKAEGRVVRIPEDATDSFKRDLIAAESVRLVRRRGEMVIAETVHGLVCANAGIDASNTEPGTLCLLPADPDLSARRIRARLGRLTGVQPGVIISDTFGRPWRVGQTNVAIGVAGIEPIDSYIGKADTFGKQMVATAIAVADEIASAAELVMGKVSQIPVALVRGSRAKTGRGSARQLVRPAADDLFR